MHKEGFTNDGSPEYTKHNPFVDNILIVEIKENMSWTMTARIEALIIFFGVDDESRKSVLSLEKIMEAICS